jgi:branched-chain amino acid transport system ATP-binding protein
LAASLLIQDVDAAYGAVRALDGVSLNVATGETVALLGTNGNGKTTLMRCILGLLRPTRGRIALTIDGTTTELIGRSPEEIVDLGIAIVPEGRRLFPRLSVEENLLLGAYRRAARAAIPRNLEFCYDAFPRLKERRSQQVSSMSGGEQQMVALGRAVMCAPKLLLVDEPSVGLAPILVARTIGKIAELKEKLGLTVLMAEQNFHQAIRIADRGYVLVHGRVEFQGDSPAALGDSDLVRKFYLGL